MQVFIRTLALTFALGIVAIALGLFSTHPAGAAGSAPVMVTNTPLPVQCTVSAAQSGAWNVGITGGTVNVANSASSPVFARDVDNAARQPFQKNLCIPLSGTFLPFCAGIPDRFAVPDGRRLVIEQVAGDCVQQSGTQVVEISFRTQVGSDLVPYPFPLQPPPTFSAPSGLYVTSLNHLTRIYADPGTTVDIPRAQLIGGVEAYCVLGVSGYLVNQ
jgi:hypothetical protein